MAWLGQAPCRSCSSEGKSDVHVAGIGTGSSPPIYGCSAWAARGAQPLVLTGVARVVDSTGCTVLYATCSGCWWLMYVALRLVVCSTAVATTVGDGLACEIESLRVWSHRAACVNECIMQSHAVVPVLNYGLVTSASLCPELSLQGA